jgi:hypothetical protein
MDGTLLTVCFSLRSDGSSIIVSATGTTFPFGGREALTVDEAKQNLRTKHLLYLSG